MSTLTHDQMVSEINAGHTVTYRGTKINNVNDVPSDNQIATDTASALQTRASQNPNLSNALVYKGVIDCSTNPSYPAADAGHSYIVSVAGKIGGASGVSVEVGDMIICKTDGVTAGTQAQKGAYWNIVQGNLAGPIPVRATGAEINTGTDDAKYVTPAAIAASQILQGDATGALIFADEEISHTSGDLYAALKHNRWVSPVADVTYNIFGALLNVGVWAPVNVANTITGLWANPWIDNTAHTAAGIVGVDSVPTNTSASTVVKISGYESNPESDVGTVTRMDGLKTLNAIYGGTVVNSCGVRIVTSEIGANKVTNNYGVYIEPHTQGTALNYNIFSAGATSKNMFEGLMYLPALPTSDPAVAGQLWRSGNDVKVSTG